MMVKVRSSETVLFSRYDCFCNVLPIQATPIYMHFMTWGSCVAIMLL